VVVAEVNGEAVADLLRRVGRLPRHVPSLHGGNDVSTWNYRKKEDERTSPWCQTVWADGEMILGDHTLRFAGTAVAVLEKTEITAMMDMSVEVSCIVVVLAEERGWGGWAEGESV
jgi:hypothetical protein